MKTHVINHTGNAAIARYDLPFDPAFAFVIPLFLQMPSVHAEEMWGARTTAIGADDSVTYGCRFIDRQLLIGPDPLVNDNGKAYRIVVLGLEDGDFPVPSWCGNAIAGRVIDLDNNTARPVAAFVKRDNTLPGVIKISGSPTVATNGAAVADCIALTDGSLTLTDADHVNEWKPAIGVGEGLAGVVFGPSAAVVGTYTGTGAAQSIALGADCEIALIWRTSGSLVYIAIRGLNVAKACDATTPLESSIGLMGGRLAFGGATLNAAGVSYSYLGVKRNQPIARENRAPSAIIRGKRAMYNHGRGTIGYADFGTGLNLNGAMSITWTGQVFGDAISNELFDAPMLLKAAAASGSTSAGVASWGLMAVSRIDDDLHGWCGPHIVGVVSGRVSHIKPLTTSTWRTGVISPVGFHHHALVHRGGGRWDYYLDGVLRKQRAEATDAVVSSATHRITMGARWNGSGYNHSSRMTCLGASVYSRPLSSDEVRILAEHDLRGASQDVTSGLAERWDGSTLSGSTWAAAVDSANNGTLIGGAIAVDL